MSRSGYVEDVEDNWMFIRWRGCVASAARGHRGQQFFRDLIAALDNLPEKKLVRGSLVAEDGCCAMGAVALHRGVRVDDVDIDPEDDFGESSEIVAQRLNIANALAKEVAFVNDEDGPMMYEETPEERFRRVRAWAVNNLQG